MYAFVFEVCQPKEQFVWALFKSEFVISCVIEKVHVCTILAGFFASTFCHKHYEGFMFVGNLTTNIMKNLS